MRKKIRIYLLCLCCIFPTFTHAEPDSSIALAEVETAVLMEPVTGTEIFCLDANAQQGVAGLSKLPAILTLAQAFDEGAISADASVRISAYAASVPGPTAFLEAGDSLRADELLKAAVMISAGDAIMALGEHLYGSEDVFTENIRITLRLAGLKKEIITALGAGASYSARELALLGTAAIASASFLRYSALYMDTITHPDGRVTELVNANRLIRSYAGCAGLLTGSSPEDGYGGVFFASRGDMPLIAVVIGAANASDRFQAAERMLQHGFSNYRLVCFDMQENGAAYEIQVRGGEKKKIRLVADREMAVLIKKTDADPTELCDIPGYLTAPVDANEPVGNIVWKDAAGETLVKVQLYPESDVAAFGFVDILHRIARSFIGKPEATTAALHE